MSHFTTLVIGGDPHALLAPYDEDIDVAPYFDPLGPDDWPWRFFINKDDSPITAESTPEEVIAACRARWSDHYYVVQDGQLGELSTYNPLSKWDWWTVGGRWSGVYGIDQGTIGEFREAIHVMRAEVEAKAGRDWDRARPHRHLYVPPPDRGEPHEVWQDWWKTKINGFLDALKEDGAEFSLFGPSSEEVTALATMSRQDYVTMHGNVDPLPFSICTPEGWLEKGRMGWFGASTDTDDSRAAYADRVWNLIDHLPDDTPATLCDLHI